MRVTHNHTLCNASRLTTVNPTSKQLSTKLSAAPVRQSDHGANVSSETAITLMSRRDHQAQTTTLKRRVVRMRERNSGGGPRAKRHNAALASHAITVNHVGFAFVGHLYQMPLQSAYVLTRAASRC